MEETNLKMITTGCPIKEQNNPQNKYVMQEVN